MSNFSLYLSLLKALVGLLPAADAARLVNLTLMVLALSQSHNCRLAALVTVWPIFGKRESLIQRARRWLSNRYLNQRIYYFPLVKHILDNWDGVEIALSMDRTDIHNRLSILMVGVCYKKRVIPLAWMVLGYGSTSAQTQIELLKSIQHLLPKGVRVTLFADCEFRAVDLQKYCRKNQWHWQIGVKSDTYYRLDGQDQWQPLSTLKPKKGGRLYLQNI